MGVSGSPGPLVLLWPKEVVLLHGCLAHRSCHSRRRPSVLLQCGARHPQSRGSSPPASPTRPNLGHAPDPPRQRGRHGHRERPSWPDTGDLAPAALPRHLPLPLLAPGPSGTTAFSLGKH